MNYNDPMTMPRPFRWSDYPVLVAGCYVAVFLAGFLGGMIACAWVLVRLIP